MNTNYEKGINRLKDASSPYLRDAAEQPVQWYQWSEKAFQRAQKQDKPILLDIGAVWCHWCHVIDRESYNDSDIANIINEKFIPIKVDRDERPDIDARYQKAVQAISGQGGWPLTAFLTPDGEVFYGGTYFPPESKYGRPGMKDILPQIASFYQENKQGALENAEKVREHLHDMAIDMEAGDISPEVVENIVQQIVKNYDETHGGFGGSPKFPSTPVLELLTFLMSLNKEEQLADIVIKTLTAMAKGGFHDQLGGAFHRYSVDASWHVPHFEVMSYVNSELLKLYVMNYQLHGEDYFRDVAEHLVEYVLRKGADVRNGGFYASQDADYSMEDDGDYWTWSVDEVAEVLDEQSTRIIREYFDIQKNGDMQENPQKNVLRIAMRPQQIATGSDLDKAAVESIIEESCRKLLSAREKRPEPFIDSSLYVDWNCMMAEAFLEAGRVFQKEKLTTLAKKTLDRIWKDGWDSQKGMMHKLGKEETGNSGQLSDHIYFVKANSLVAEYTSDSTYLSRAQQVMDYTLGHFWSNESGGFFDRIPDTDDFGFLEIPAQPIQDAPLPGENAVAALTLQHLHAHTNQKIYGDKAELTLQKFAGSIEKYGMYASTYAIATARLLNEPLQIMVIDNGESTLWNAALRARYPLEILKHFDSQVDENELPKTARAILKNKTIENAPIALICTSNACTQPIYDVGEFKERLAELRAQ